MTLPGTLDPKYLSPVDTVKDHRVPTLAFAGIRPLRNFLRTLFFFFLKSSTTCTVWGLQVVNVLGDYLNIFVKPTFLPLVQERLEGCQAAQNTFIKMFL